MFHLKEFPTYEQVKNEINEAVKQMYGGDGHDEGIAEEYTQDLYAACKSLSKNARTLSCEINLSSTIDLMHSTGNEGVYDPVEALRFALQMQIDEAKEELTSLNFAIKKLPSKE